MIKKIYCTTVLLLCMAFASAQSTAWKGQFGGDGEDVVLAIHTDSNGNTYTTGYFSLSCDFDLSENEAFLHTNTEFECFIQKVDPDGNLLWVIPIGGASSDYGTKITTDTDGNVYVTGVFQETADFDPSDGEILLTSAGSLDIFVAKYNEHGEYKWAKHFPGAEYEESNGIGVDTDGNVYISGYFYAAVDFDPGVDENILTAVGGDGFLVKLDTNGNFAWAKQFGGADFDLATGMRTMPNGDVYISGNFSATADFDPSETGTHYLTADANTGGIYVLQLKANGDFVKAVKVGQVVNGGYGLSVDVDSTGAAYVTGYLTGVGTFLTDGGEVTMTPSEYLNAYLAKVTNEGTVEWAKQLTSDMLSTGYAVAVNSADEVLVSGYFNGTLTLGDVTLVETSENDSENFVVKMDSHGNFIWGRQFGGINVVDRFAMSVGSDDSIFLSGAFENTVDIDPDANQMTTVTTMGFRDNFLIKLNGAPLSVQDHAAKATVALYPNPVKNTVHLSGTDAFEGKPFLIYDLAGRRVSSGNISGQSIDLSALQTGWYNLKIDGQTFKVIKE